MLVQELSHWAAGSGSVLNEGALLQPTEGLIYKKYIFSIYQYKYLPCSDQIYEAQAHKQ
jgi:hypothetical protein